MQQWRLRLSLVIVATLLVGSLPVLAQGGPGTADFPIRDFGACINLPDFAVESAPDAYNTVFEVPGLFSINFAEYLLPLNSLPADGDSIYGAMISLLDTVDAGDYTRVSFEHPAYVSAAVEFTLDGARMFGMIYRNLDDRLFFLFADKVEGFDMLAIGRAIFPADDDCTPLSPDAAPTAALPTFAITPGVVEFHPAMAAIRYPFYTYVPRNLSRRATHRILITSQEGWITDDYNVTIANAGNALQNQLPYGFRDFIVLTVPIPRSMSQNIYAVAFAYKVFDPNIDPFYYRPDLVVNTIVDTYAASLREAGYTIDDQIMLEGYSAGGMFAQLYALLHPERVYALAAGAAGGSYCLPEATYGDTPLIWPLGIADYETLVGRPFNRDAYRQVYQLLYVGDQDTNTTAWGTGELWREQWQIDWLNATFGGPGPLIYRNQAAYLAELGYDCITYREYPGLGHEYTRQMRADALAFLRNPE